MRRRAEVVVVAAMLLVVGGLAAPAIVCVRRAAGAIQCRNNLKSLGMGVESYRQAHGYFPPATVDCPGLPPDRRLSWYVDLYGFMIGGEELLLDKKAAWDAEVNREPKYRVPKDNNRVEVIGAPRWLVCLSNPLHAEPGSPGWTHYVGLAGVGQDAALLPIEDKRAGVFGYDRTTRLEDIKDGTSTTLLVIETATDNGPWTAGGRATVRGLDPGQPPYLGRDGQFGSRHRGSVTNAVFVDGSVRSLGAGIDPKVFEALATIAGGEDVGHVGHK